MCPTYTYPCSKCDHVTDVFYKLSEVRPDIQPCEVCGEIANYKLAAPMVLKASFLDGQRSRAWKDVREASKLNLAAAGTDNLQEKAEINKEVKKIGYNFTKDDV
jgi:predicted nucleic acid-binding Zn ribbon protein